MHRHLKIPILTLLAVSVGGLGRARAEDTTKTDEANLKLDTTFGLDPTAPQTGALPGGLAPAYGQKAMTEGEWRFDFHGFLTAPLVASIGSRTAAFNDPNAVRPGQSNTTLHSPPVVPDDLETFSHTGVVPTTYAQLNFSEGNSIVTAHASLLARQANVSTSFIEPASQLGVTDLYLSVLPRLPSVRTEVLVGAFTSRYGTTGEYDEGRYGTPLIARVNGAGERITARLPIGKKLVLLGEEGLVGQSNKANAATTPDVWNDFANSNEGATFVAHVHLGLAYDRLAQVGLHYLGAWSQDDRGTGTLAPDGSIDVYAADLRLTMGRFGYLYLAGSYTDAKWAKTVSRIFSVLNTRGGQGLIDNYFGPTSNGNGTLTTIGGQYDLSIGRLVSYPVPFNGDGPDLFVSLFGMVTHVTSDDKVADSLGRFFDNVTKQKFGAEVSYSVLAWLAFSGRFDHVDPDRDDTRFSFNVVSPRVILRTDWQATDQLVIQYSHWFNGTDTLARSGNPPHETLYPVPDKDMISISASMWW